MANYLVVGGLEGYKADYRACREQRAREKMLHLTNFKNFAEAHLDDTEPVTMLVGPHGAGKSNLIEATELLSFLAGGRPLHQVTDLGRQGPLEVRGGLDACASFGQTSFTLGHSLIVATAEGAREKSGHVGIFDGLDTSSPMEQVCDTILDEYLWFKILESRNPDRFACFFEHEPCKDILVGLATLLELVPEEDWLTNAAKAFEIKGGYTHPESLVTFFRNGVDKRFSSYPDFAEKLLRFFPRVH